MDKQFELQDVDEVSSIPTPHFSYIVQQLLPARIVGGHRLKNTDIMLKSYTEKSNENCKILPVGSLVEGLNMPPIIKKSKKKYQRDDLSDMDLMAIKVKKLVTFDKSKVESEDYFALAETDDIHIGYARINYFKSHDFPMYYNHYALQDQIIGSYLDEYKSSKGFGAIGPAITLWPEDMPNTNFKLPGKPLSVDLVYALPCKEWPPIAMDWIKRSHEKGWLTSSFIESVTQDGCHFVPVAHRSSPTPHKEWRISFVATEQRIAREIVTDSQRQAYILIKLLYHQALKEKGIITSYHLKNIFFHACERISQAAWDENIGACIFYFLDLIIDCIRKKNIPSFFLPDNNLIDWLTDEDMPDLLETLQQLRNDPIAAILQFMDDKCIALSSVRYPFRSMLTPVLSDMKAYIEHRDMNRTVLEAFVPTSFKILLNQLAEGKSTESVHLATELHSLLLNYKLTEENLPQFLSWNIANHMTDGRMSANFLEAVIALHGDEEEFNCCRDQLPCMYHAAAYRYPAISKEHKEYLEKADQGFLSRFSQQGVSRGYCNYVLLLMKKSQHKEAIPWLDKVIDSDNTNLGNVYDANEIMTVDEMIQNEIVEHNNFSAPSISLAYYLKASCLHEIKENTKDVMKTLLENFKCHSDIVKLPRTYALLGYTYMECGEWKAASDTLSLAVKADTQGEYSRALKMKEYCDKMIKQNTKARL